MHLKLWQASNAGGLSQDELQKRAEYLRQQRDKLLASKKTERTKHLNIYEESQPQKRPKSSRAARSVIGGHQAQHNVDEKTLEMRVALAQKLKKEVIGKDV